MWERLYRFAKGVDKASVAISNAPTSVIQGAGAELIYNYGSDSEVKRMPAGQKFKIKSQGVWGEAISLDSLNLSTK